MNVGNAISPSMLMSCVVCVSLFPFLVVVCSIWIFLNGMFGVALMCAILQVCWDPSWQLSRYTDDVSVPADYYSDIDWVYHRLSLTPEPLPHAWTWHAVAAECPSPTRSIVMEVLKMILTLSTLILCWQILDRKKLQIHLKFREQRRKLKAKGIAHMTHDHDKLFLNSLASSSKVSTLGLLSLSRSQFRWELWASILVCMIQPIPFTHQLTGGFIDDKIGILMWMRIFLGLRVVRDCSEIWLNRRSIKHQSSFQTKVPDFSWWLSCKTMSYRSPLTFAGVFYTLCVIIFGHSLYIAERERLPSFFNIWSSLFVCFQIVSVGWPADVWEIYMPITIFGKMVSVFAGMAGLILISFVIVTVGSALHPSRFEENALLYIQLDKIRQRERDGSASLIQYVWRNAQREAELEAKLAPKNPGLYEEISEQEEKVFMENFIQKSKELRTVRRERAELEERSDPTSERNISPMDLYFDTKLEAIRTDIMHQNAKNNQQAVNIIATLNQLLHRTTQKEKQAKQQQQQQQQTMSSSNSSGKKSRSSLGGRRSQSSMDLSTTSATMMDKKVASVSSNDCIDESSNSYGATILRSMLPPLDDVGVGGVGVIDDEDRSQTSNSDPNSNNPANDSHDATHGMGEIEHYQSASRNNVDLQSDQQQERDRFQRTMSDDEEGNRSSHSPGNETDQ